MQILQKSVIFAYFRIKYAFHVESVHAFQQAFSPGVSMKEPPQKEKSLLERVHTFSLVLQL
jgi:hypothetical protein